MTKGTEMNAETDDWMDKRVSEARGARKAAVTDAVAIRITRLLNGKLGEVPLTPKKLADTAKELLGDMANPVAPDVQADDET